MIQALMPRDKDAELGLLSAIIEAPEQVLFECAELGLSADDFYHENNARIFKAINYLFENNVHIDGITIADRLRATGDLDNTVTIKDIEHIGQLFTSVYKSKSYAEIVKSKSILRSIELAAINAIKSVESNQDDHSVALAEAQERFLSIKIGRELKCKDRIKNEIIDGWTIAAQGGVSGLHSPWKSFDKKLGGPQPGQVTVVAGFKGRGKSTIVHNWAYELAKEGRKIGVMPFEDGATIFYKRMAGNHGDFSVFSRDTGWTTDWQMDKAKRALDEVMELPVYVEDRPMNISQVIAWSIQCKARHKLDAIFIDGFKDIIRTGRLNESVEEDNRISRSLCDLAKRLWIPIIVIHHIKKTENEVCTIDDIRGSGRITDDARQVIILQFDGENYYLDIAKNNNGPTGAVKVERQGDRQRFIETEEEVRDVLEKTQKYEQAMLHQG